MYDALLWVWIIYNDHADFFFFFRKTIVPCWHSLAIFVIWSLFYNVTLLLVISAEFILMMEYKIVTFLDLLK